MAGKVITDFIKIQMYKKGGAIATDKAVQFAANALEKRLINLGIDPSTLNSLLGTHARDSEPVLEDGKATGTGDGAAAALVCSARFLLRRPEMGRRAVQIAAQALVTDLPQTLQGRSYISLSGYDMGQRAAKEVYEASGLQPADVDVVEVHDCFSCAELLAYEALGLCKEGEGGKLIDSAEWEATNDGGSVCRIGRAHNGGGWVVNPSGGLESKGHPIGATGLGQAYELVTQLRGEAGPRQVKTANVGLQHNFGVGGAVVVSLYRGPNATAALSRAPRLPHEHTGGGARDAPCRGMADAGPSQRANKPRSFATASSK